MNKQAIPTGSAGVPPATVAAEEPATPNSLQASVSRRDAGAPSGRDVAGGGPADANPLPASVTAEGIAIPAASHADASRLAAGAPSRHDVSAESTFIEDTSDKAGTGATPAHPVDTPTPPVPGDERPDRRPVVAAILGAVVLLFALLSRWPLDAKLRLVGAACCAQAPTRTLRIGGSLMPVDARDAGIYLTGLLALAMAVLVGRARAGRFPPGNVTALLAGFFVAMILDGVNSSLQARGLHPLYHTTNTVRVITGAGAGLALALLGVPVVNRVVWRQPGDDAFAASYGELGGFLAAAAVLVALLLSPRPWLYYPLSLLSILGVLVGWGLINGMVVAVATRREHRAVSLADGGLLLLAGIALTLCEIGAIDLLRLGIGH